MKNKGFTLIEILIVIAVGVTLSTAGFLSYNAMSERKDVELSLQELSATVESIQRRSVNQQDGARWSMRFTANSEGADKYEIYSGETYSTSSVEQSYSFNRPVHFSEPSGDRSVDLNFEPVTGQIDNKKVITITNNSQSARAGDLILNTLGLVTGRMEDDIVGYWHFDEGSGATTTDASGEGNVGNIIGATWESEDSCIAGQCLDFDGSGDYVALDMYYDSNDSLEAFTVSVWYKTTDSGGGYNSNWAFLDFDRSEWFDFYLRSDNGRLGFSGADGVNDYFDIESDTSSNDGQWHHGAVVYDSDNNFIKFYLDGDLDGTFNYTNLNSITDTSIRYGFIGDGSEASSFNGSRNSAYYDGLLDELKMYNRALSADEIQRMYNDLKP